MRNILTALFASIAVLAFASSAFAMGGCGFGHTKQVMASVEDDEATTMSTFDDTVKLPETVSEADEANLVPSDEEAIAE